MDEEYDVVVLGTGLKECILSGLLSISKLKVLHIDRNNYYGGESASLNLEDLYKRFRGDEAPPAELGRPRDYCVDLCPKFLMACGDIVKLLLHTRVTRYLEFKSVAGCYVVQGGKIYKVPATPVEALNSGLMGIFQKRKFRNFLQYVNNYKESDPKTHEKMDLNKVTCRELFKHFGLEENTILFTGHCIALHLDDDYLDQPAKDLVERCKLYAYSLSRYGNSPFIYPIWGLGGLPEGFSRLCAVHGGVYMLNKPVDEIVLGPDGKVCGVRSGNETAKCKMVLCDPSYVLNTPLANRVKKTGQVARMIAIMNHPIPNTNQESCQLIIPGKEAKRKNDIYVSMVSYHHRVAPTGRYIVVCSTVVETKEPEKELAPAVNLLGPIEQKFFWVSDVYEPVSDGKADNLFISSSYDATTHFETATREAIAIYERMTGRKLDMSISAEPEDLEDKTAEATDLSGGAAEENKAEPSQNLEEEVSEVNRALDQMALPEESPKEGEGAAPAAGADASARS